MNRKVSSVAVIGAGSAGLLAALGIRKINPRIAVKVIYSSKVPVIGVGESTQPNLPNYVHNFLELPYDEFYRHVRPTWKLGLKFTWGQRPHFNYPFQDQYNYRPAPDMREPGFYCHDSVLYTNELAAAMDLDRSPVFKDPDGRLGMRLDHAYHIENRKFVGYLMKKAPDFGIKLVDAEVVDFDLDEQGYVARAILKDQDPVEADLWIDSSGFESLLLGDKLGVPFVSYGDKLYCDRAVVGGHPYEPADAVIRPYTCVDTMDSGWCFTIDHDDISNAGYVFSSRHLSDDEAFAEFLKFRPLVKQPRLIPFKTGRYEKLWHKNVIGMGNASGFIEPLEATALAVICRASTDLAFALNAAPTVSDKMVDRYNQDVGTVWDVTRDFIAFHYAFNDRRDTKFWQDCRAELPHKLGYYQDWLAFYQANGPTSVMARHLFREGDLFKLDGFLSLAIGMRVPYHAEPNITDRERRTWEQIRSGYRDRGRRALPQREALKIIAAPQWRWPKPSLSPYYQQGG
jgi:tryptophan halogenase